MLHLTLAAACVLQTRLLGRLLLRIILLIKERFLPKTSTDSVDCVLVFMYSQNLQPVYPWIVPDCPLVEQAVFLEVLQGVSDLSFSQSCKVTQDIT